VKAGRGAGLGMLTTGGGADDGLGTRTSPEAAAMGPGADDGPGSVTSPEAATKSGVDDGPDTEAACENVQLW
jgi:hypothetical protein